MAKIIANLENVITSALSKTRGDAGKMASKYRERVKIGVDKNGCAVYEWARGSTKQDLYQSIADILNEKERGKKKHAGWSDYAQKWYETYHVPNLRAKTAVKDASIMRNHVSPAFGDIDISSISTTDVQEYLNTKSGYSKSHVRDIIWMMRAIFSSAVDDGLIERNPMDSDRIVNSSKVKQTMRKALRADEQRDIIEHLNDLTEPNARRLMAFLMFTSMRPCEIYGLKWEDIDFNSGFISIKRDLVFVNGMGLIDDTKTYESTRIIPLDKRLIDYLKPCCDEGFVISMNGERSGEHLSSESVARHLWNRIKKKIDVHGMTPYVGRHTFATNMNRAGVPIRTAMSVMGHKDERMLLRTYTHVDQTDLLNAGATMSNYMEAIVEAKATRCAP